MLRGARSRPASPGRQRGFALLVVLWWVVLLALVGEQLAASGRLEAQRAGNVRAAAIARAAAEGALQEAAFHLLDDGPDRWMPGGPDRLLPVPGGTARVAIRSERGKIGVNVATPALLAALLRQVGVAAAEASAMADAIADWRSPTQQRRPLGAKAADYEALGLAYAPPGADFETLAELALVRGMSPPLLAQLAPYLSVYQEDGVDLAEAAPPVREAMREAGALALTDDRANTGASGSAVLDITVTVELRDGTRTKQESAVRLTTRPQQSPLQVLGQ